MTAITTNEGSLQPELMDALDLPLEETGRALADLDRVNRWLFGHSASCRALRSRISNSPESQRLIDLGTGSGTVTAYLQQTAAKRGIRLQVIGVDRKLGHLLFGRQLGNRHLRVVAAAEALPFRDEASDWSFSNLFFHHFSPGQNRRILTEMQRVSRRGSLIIDLRRALCARALVRLLLPLLRVGPVASYDGRVSTDQAWCMKDLAKLTSGLPVLELRRRFPFRFSLVLENHFGPTEPRVG
jgi:ubiquinone/menaquinone biosynthesis C-methylase UbiE